MIEQNRKKKIDWRKQARNLSSLSLSAALYILYILYIIMYMLYNNIDLYIKYKEVYNIYIRSWKKFHAIQ